MSVLSSTRRTSEPLTELRSFKERRELLAGLCAARRRARILPLTVPTHPDRRTGIASRFLALEADSVLLDWPRLAADDLPPPGATVEVCFAYGDAELGFRTHVLGPAWSRHAGMDGRTGIAAWRLKLPVRIHRYQLRRHFRVGPDGLGPVTVRCTCVDDAGRAFVAQLRNLSAGGLSASADRCYAPYLRPGALFWVQFELPGQPEPFEFVVRIVHTQRHSQAGGIVFGGTFCPSEDLTRRREQLDRIAQLAGGRQRAASQDAAWAAGIGA